MDPELQDLLPDEVLVEKYKGSDGFGKEVYDDPVAVPARVSGRIQRVRGADGVERTSRIQVLLGEPLTISEKDRFTLPERFSTKPDTPEDTRYRRLVPLAVSSTSDEVGVHHEKAYF